MIIVNNGRTLEDGALEPRHTIEKVCAACGYDLDASELENDSCADCGAPLNLQENISIVVASLPMTGGVM